MSKNNKQIIENLTKLIKQTDEECYQLKEEAKKLSGDKQTQKKKEATGCQFKMRNFKKALDIIESLSQKIESSDDLKGIPGIGQGTRDRVDEIIKTGTLAELKPVKENNSTFDEIEKLILITGVGPKSAHKLYSSGLTLDKLLQQMAKVAEGDDPRNMSIDEIIDTSEEMDLNLHDLTHHQLVGLKYFHDIEERIPRKEMEKIEAKLIKMADKIDDKLMITVCGSYRRKKPTSGDIDVLITHPDLETEDDVREDAGNYLINIIKRLSEDGLLVDHLTSLGTTKYMGVCRLTKKSKGRRIDIRFVARDDYAPALLYFTGSKDFNTTMRSEALSKGYTINEYGIYKLRKKTGRYINKKGEKIVAKTEKEIFDLVGMKYLKPEERG